MPPKPVTYGDIFHYTNSHNLSKIVESKSLLSTHLGYLNDTQEFFTGRERILRHLRYMHGELEGQEFIDPERVKREKPILELAIATFKGMSAPNVFVASFSKKRDDLSQWRGYTKIGLGVCLGFDSAEIRRIAALQDFVLEDCEYLYVDAGHSELIYELLQVLRRGDFPDEHQLKLLMARVKHQAFWWESETRLIYSEQGKRPVIDIDGIPRVKLDLSGDPALCLRSVTISPSPENGLPERTKHLLDSHGISDVIVLPSSIPYRPKPTTEER